MSPLSHNNQRQIRLIGAYKRPQYRKPGVTSPDILSRSRIRIQQVHDLVISHRSAAPMRLTRTRLRSTSMS